MPQPVHNLSQMGIMTSFSVAKKVTAEEATKFFHIKRKCGKTKKELEAMLQKKIERDIQTAVMNNQVPGLISISEWASESGMAKTVGANLPELNRLISVISDKLLSSNYDKLSLCYFINTMVNILNLQEADFEKFHSQPGENPGEGDDSDDGEEYRNA